MATTATDIEIFSPDRSVYWDFCACASAAAIFDAFGAHSIWNNLNLEIRFFFKLLKPTPFNPLRKRSRSSLDLVTTSISGRCSTFQAGISDSRGPNVSLESFQVWTPYHKRQQQLFFEEDGIRQTQTDCSLFGILPDDILEMVLLFAVRGHADISTNSRVCRRFEISPFFWILIAIRHRWRIFVNHENVWKRMCLRGWQNKDSVILTGFFKPRNKTWKQAYVSRLVGTHLHFMIPQQFLSVSVRSSVFFGERKSIWTMLWIRISNSNFFECLNPGPQIHSC